MANYIFTKEDSDLVKQLSGELGLTRLRFFDGMDVWKSGKKLELTPSDNILLWNVTLPDLGTARIIRASDKILGKPRLVEHFANTGIGYVNMMPWEKKVPNSYIGRSSAARNAQDLVCPQNFRVDYITSLHDIEQEFRVYFFDKKAIRIMKKQPKPGLEKHRGYGWEVGDENRYYHPKFRSLSLGWELTPSCVIDTPSKIRSLITKLRTATISSFQVDIVITTQREDAVVIDLKGVELLDPEVVGLYTKAIKKAMKKQEDL